MVARMQLRSFRVGHVGYLHTGPCLLSVALQGEVVAHHTTGLWPELGCGHEPVRQVPQLCVGFCDIQDVAVDVQTLCAQDGDSAFALWPSTELSQTG